MSDQGPTGSNFEIYFQGTHELNVSESEESADLHRGVNLCKKNPEHRPFIPVNDFTLDRLPEKYQDQDIYDVIKALADLTVKITVSYVSLGRPQVFQGSAAKYPFYDFRGSFKRRTGTGLIDNVTKYQDAPCQCQTCKHSDAPKNEWAEIEVFTAVHVIFDDSEAHHATCRLFYDDRESPEIVLDDVRVWEADIDKDKCRLTCVTHDVDLIDRLIDINGRRKVLCREVRGKFWNLREEEKLTVIVSHPHGCAKQVTIGEWERRDEVGIHSLFTYTTSTCPGSSGAYVYIVGSVGWWYEYVHKGVNMNGENSSGAGFDPDFR